MRPSAILFDLDNTLVDRDASLKEYAYRFYVDFRERLEQGEAKTVLDVITRVDAGGYGGWDTIINALETRLAWISPPRPSELAAHRFDHYAPSAKAMVGLYKTLHQLRQQGFVLGIITNGSEHSQQGKIDFLELAPYLSTIVISGAIGIKKPDARIFETALAEINLSADVTWFVGDHPMNDMLGAAAVGLTPVWRRGFHPWPDGHTEPESQIDSLTDIFTLLDQETG